LEKLSFILTNSSITMKISLALLSVMAAHLDLYGSTACRIPIRFAVQGKAAAKREEDIG
jgi:hypothetical protein